MARDKYDKELHQLRMEIFQLGSLVGRMTTQGVKSVVSCDPELAAAVIADEVSADDQARAIEQHAELLIATQAPMASDMRQVASALIVAQELERMADHAHDIAHASAIVCRLDRNATDVDALEPLGQRVTEMLRMALQAYLTGDAPQAARIAGMDDGVDDLYRAYYQALLASMASERQLVERGVTLMHVAYDLERIADRVTNICERVVFIATGEIPEPSTTRVA